MHDKENFHHIPPYLSFSDNWFLLGQTLIFASVENFIQWPG